MFASGEQVSAAGDQIMRHILFATAAAGIAVLAAGLPAPEAQPRRSRSTSTRSAAS
jgi:hypothetical protein